MGFTILFFIIISTQPKTKSERASKELYAQSQLIDERIFDEKKNQVVLRNSLNQTIEESQIVEGSISDLIEQIQELEIEISNFNNTTVASTDNVNQIKADIKQIIEDNKRLQTQIENTQNNSYLKSFGLIGIGIVVLYIGAMLTVDNAVVIAVEFGLSEKIIGLTVIAIGTSLPELITSIIAIRKGHADVGIGNIIGSNIYNILMIMGVGAALGGVLVTSDVYVDYAIMIIFSLSLLIGLKTKIINRTMGIIFTAGYVLYLATTFFK